ncbi:MAG TPA: mechanosensitive ion channel family protein [Lysobacter sp.]
MHRALAGLLVLMLGTAAATPTPPPADVPSGGAAPQAQAQRDDGTTVRYFNRDIVTLRDSFLGRTPQIRARAAEENIERIVRKPGEAKVAFRQEPKLLAVFLGNELLMAVTPADLDALDNETLDDARRSIERNLGDAVAAAERDRTPRLFLYGVLWSLLATGIAVVLVAGLMTVSRRAQDALQRWMAGRVSRLHTESARHFAGGMRTMALWALRAVLWLLVLLTVEEWLRFVLGQFGFTRPWALAMTGWVVERLSALGNGIARAVPGLVAAAVILFLARLLAQTVSLTFRGVQSGRFKVFGIDSELAEPTRKIVVGVIWLFGIAMAYPYLPGAQTDAFKGLSVLVGLMISLGASSIVGQAASGFTLLYARTMSVGELVRIGEVEGVVQQVGMFTTRLRTITGVEVSVPNNVVLAGQLHNYSRNPDGPGMWLETGVTIGYDTPWRQVHKLLLDAAAKTAGVQPAPAPFVLQTALSDFYVEYRLRARIENLLGRALILSELHGHIQDAFNRAGVQIMSPNYEADPEQPKLVAPAHWDGRPATEPDATPDGR